MKQITKIGLPALALLALISKEAGDKGTIHEPVNIPETGRNQSTDENNIAESESYSLPQVAYNQEPATSLPPIERYSARAEVSRFNDEINISYIATRESARQMIVNELTTRGYTNIRTDCSLPIDGYIDGIETAIPTADICFQRNVDDYFIFLTDPQTEEDLEVYRELEQLLRELPEGMTVTTYLEDQDVMRTRFELWLDNLEGQ